MELGWHQVGRRRAATGPAGSKPVSANPGTSHRNRLEIGDRRIRGCSAHRSDQLRRSTASKHTRWTPDRPGLVTNAANCQQGSVSNGHTIAHPIAVTEGSGDRSACRCGAASSSSSSCRPCAGSLRCSDGRRCISCLCGRQLELQQDSQRHMLPSRRGALVDGKPRASGTRRALVSSDVVNDSSTSDARETRG